MALGMCNIIVDICCWDNSEENLMISFATRVIGFLNLRTR